METSSKRSLALKRKVAQPTGFSVLRRQFDFPLVMAQGVWGKGRGGEGGRRGGGGLDNEPATPGASKISIG